jgi:hypothetical protein
LTNEIAVEVAGRYAESDAPFDPSLKLADLQDLLRAMDAEWPAQIDLLKARLINLVLRAEILSEEGDERARQWAIRLVRSARDAAAVVADLQRTLDATGPPNRLSGPLPVPSLR